MLIFRDSLSVFSLFTSFISLIRMQEVNFSYFGTGFPKNYPLIWNIYSVFMGILSIYVYMKRSYSLLLKYTVLGSILIAISILNSIYFVFAQTNQTQIVFTMIIYGIGYFLAVLIMLYVLCQKKYFNKT